VPNVCFKIPTGGGKTLLAVEAVSRLFGKHLLSNSGLVLWVVPNEAIYTQTKKQLTDREHPYRQRLDRVAAGKVKILEKNDRLNSRDLESHLCIMLLMLPSANRESKETLRLFRDRGNVHGFFPPEGDFPTHCDLLDRIPNLTAYGDRSNRTAIIQDSLGNILRFIRPVVIMDEGHKAYSTSAIKTVYDFNPCFVLELSATPKDRPRDGIFSNWLVDVRGIDLDREEMIKLPINVKVRAGDDWQACLQESAERLNQLQQAAETLRANSNRYIRPILLVQVERTGKEQRERGYIHTEDAKEYLLRGAFPKCDISSADETAS
jgi:type III restriction enzyme